MGTKWEAYSQTLLRLTVPEWSRYLVDGKRNWSPTGFLEFVIDKDVDFIAHVDEDCFLRTRSGLLNLIEIMEADPDLVAAGIPDGGSYYRNHNPAALNLFFVIFRADALRSAWREKNLWASRRFREEFSYEVLRQCPNLDESRVNWDEGEPYYPLFWSLLAQGGRFLYLKEQLLQPRWSSEVISPSGEIIAEHMWYLRNWFGDEIMPGHDCTNVSRYRSFLQEWYRRYRNAYWPSLYLAGMHAKRISRRLLR